MTAVVQFRNRIVMATFLNTKHAYKLITWSRTLFEKLRVAQLLKKLPVFYGSRRFNTVFTRVRHETLSWATCSQSTPSHLTSLKSILILSSHISLGLPSALPFRRSN